MTKAERIAALEAALCDVVALVDDATILHLAEGDGWASEAVRAVPTGRPRVRAVVKFQLWFER